MFNDDAAMGSKGNAPRTEPRSSNVFPSVAPRPVTQPQNYPQPEPIRSAEPSNRQPTGGRLVVGPNIKMKGVEVTDCDVVIVEGHLEAKFDSRVVEVAETGVLTGTASMDVAEIWGRFDGELTVRQQLIVHPSGSVNGNIKYAKVRIEEGGEISGQISTLKASAASERVELLKSVAAGGK